MRYVAQKSSEHLSYTYTRKFLFATAGRRDKHRLTTTSAKGTWVSLGTSMPGHEAVYMLGWELKLNSRFNGEPT